MTDGAIGAARAVPPIPAQPDSVAPLFFVSHATAYSGEPQRTDPNSPFVAFFSDLSQDVGQLVARRAGADPGFIDRGMNAGVDWEKEILAAVGTCQVFIALVSEPFARSEWCGKEWYAFADRDTWRRADEALVESPACIIPVVWAPNQNGAAPGVVAGRQLFVPDPTSSLQIGPAYRREGMYGLYMTDQPAYRATVWRLAQEVQRLVHDFWVEPKVPTGSRTLINVFSEGQP